MSIIKEGSPAELLARRAPIELFNLQENAYR